MDSVFENKDCITSVQTIQSIRILGNDDSGNDEAPYFTIAIPTYKRSSLLSDALNSALKQEGFDDYEIIVVDNNPERGDETELFMQKYAEHPRVSYYKNCENVGMAGNWNKCLLLSKSNYVVLLHDDDVIFSFYLKILSKVLMNVKQNWNFIKPDLTRFSEYNGFEPREGSKFYLKKLTLLDFSFCCPVGAPSCILFNKSKFINSGGANECFFPCIDYALNLRLSQMGNSYLLGGECLGGYRVANNESLKESTMDAYYKMRYQISNVVLKSLRVPEHLRELVQFAKIDDYYKKVQSYYNMESYRFKYENFPSFNMSPRKRRVIIRLYDLVMKINNRIHVKKIYLD